MRLAELFRPSVVRRPEALAVTMFLIAACTNEPKGGTTKLGVDPVEQPTRRSVSGETAPEPPTQVPDVPTRYSVGPDTKIAALGDLHGDLQATRRALVLAGAIDENDQWIGGALVVVQTGDQLDRGDDEREILDLLDRLRDQARQAGGAVHILNGNHEYMNAMGDFRYVTPGGLAAFSTEKKSNPALEKFPERARGRAAAFLPGGTQAKRLAQRNAVVIVGDTVFAHGGVLPKYAKEIDRINELGRSWLVGALKEPSGAIQKLMAPDSVVWTRLYSDGTPSADACTQLSESLKLMAVSRMVVGHTIQKAGITSACDDKIWRIDTGMAGAYGGKPSALLIEGRNVRPVYGS